MRPPWIAEVPVLQEQKPASCTACTLRFLSDFRLVLAALATPSSVTNETGQLAGFFVGEIILWDSDSMCCVAFEISLEHIYKERSGFKTH